MASPRPWPFHDEDRPSGSGRPLSPADLQAILAHLASDDPDQLLAGTNAIGRWWRSGCGPAWADRAAPPKPGGASNERLRGRPGPGPCPGESALFWGSVSVGESSAACSRPGGGWSSGGLAVMAAGWGCGSSPAPTPSPGDGARPGSGAPPACWLRWSDRGGRSCTTGPSPAARPTSTTWRSAPVGVRDRLQTVPRPPPARSDRTAVARPLPPRPHPAGGVVRGRPGRPGPLGQGRHPGRPGDAGRRLPACCASSRRCSGRTGRRRGQPGPNPLPRCRLTAATPPRRRLLPRLYEGG